MEPTSKETPTRSSQIQTGCHDSQTSDKIPTISDYFPKDERCFSQQCFDMCNLSNGRDKVEIF